MVEVVVLLVRVGDAVVLHFFNSAEQWQTGSAPSVVADQGDTDRTPRPRALATVEAANARLETKGLASVQSIQLACSSKALRRSSRASSRVESPVAVFSPVRLSSCPSEKWSMALNA